MAVGQLSRLVLPALVAALLLTIASPLAAQEIAFANMGFDPNWKRYDEPVRLGQANRGWTWGPASLAALDEPYAESPGGRRQVQYFDKARMELTDPGQPGAGQLNYAVPAAIAATMRSLTLRRRRRRRALRPTPLLPPTLSPLSSPTGAAAARC
jgi:hypothetical protein